MKISRVEKCRNHGSKSRICFSYDPNVKNIYFFLISVVDDRRNEIGGNFHAKNLTTVGIENKPK
jgi:hypothetical protein